MGYITHSEDQSFPFGGGRGFGGGFTQEYKPRHRNGHINPHTHSSPNEKATEQLSEEQTQRNGSRIVLCSTVAAGPCFCCFIKAGVLSGSSCKRSRHTYVQIVVRAFMQANTQTWTSIEHQILACLSIKAKLEEN